MHFEGLLWDKINDSCITHKNDITNLNRSNML